MTSHGPSLPVVDASTSPLAVAGEPVVHRGRDETSPLPEALRQRVPAPVAGA